MSIIPQLDDVSGYPDRTLPQQRFDVAMKDALNSGKKLHDDLNTNFIPAANALGAVINAVNDNKVNIDTVAGNITAVVDAHNNMSAILAAPAQASAAATSATQAGQSATAAATARTGAEAAQTGAVSAQNAAESAKSAAETARTGAETAKTGAETARTGAEAAQTGAVAAKNAAEAAQVASETARDEAVAIVGGNFVTTNTEQAVTAKKTFSGGIVGDVEGNAATATLAASVPWDGVSGKPTSYPPAAHAHGWTDVTGKPTTFPPAAHGHGASEITSGTLPVSRGGTGNSSGNIPGNAATATRLQTSRTISLTGDVTGSVSFNGAVDATITTTVQSTANLAQQLFFSSF